MDVLAVQLIKVLYTNHIQFATILNYTPQGKPIE